jgi:hypothetical protein
VTLVQSTAIPRPEASPLTTTPAELPPHPSHPDAPAIGPCTNCGAPNAELYCPRCGEQQPSHHDLSTTHFLQHAFHELLHVDSKIFGTLRLLFLQPGALTREYFAGRKTRYVAPLRLVLTAFAMMLILYTIRSTQLYRFERIMEQDKTHTAASVMEKTAAKKGVKVEALVEQLDERWAHQASALQLVNVIGFAVALQILYAGKKRYFAEHLVFSAHYLGWIYLVNCITWPLYRYTGLDVSARSIALSLTVTLIFTVYLFLALRRYYGDRPFAAAVRAVFGYGSVLLTTIVTMYAALGVAFYQTIR